MRKLLQEPGKSSVIQAEEAAQEKADARDRWGWAGAAGKSYTCPQ